MPKPLDMTEQEELELLNLNISIPKPGGGVQPPTEAGTVFSWLGDILGGLASSVGQEAIIPGGGVFAGAPPPFDLPSMTWGEGAQAVGNIPRSGMQQVQGLTSLATAEGRAPVIETAKQAIPGIPGALSKFMLPGLQIPGLQGYMESDQVKAAEAVGRDLTRLLRDPKGTIINDPIGAAMELASVVAPAGIGSVMAGQGGRIGAVGAAIQQINPVRIIIKAPAAIVKKGLKAAGKTKMGERVLASSTNVGEEAVRLAKEAGKKGERSFLDALLEPEIATQKAAEKVSRAVQKLDDMRGLGWDEMSKTLELFDTGDPINIPQVRARIFSNLEKKYDIKVTKLGVSPSNPDVGTVVLEAGQNCPIGHPAKLNELAEALKNLGQWTDPTIEAGHAAQRRLMSFVKKGPEASEYATVNKMLLEMGDEVRQEMNSKVKGYAERANLYSNMSEELKNIEKILSIKSGVITETTLTKLGTLLNDRLSSNLGLRREAVQKLSAMVGEDLMSSLAGAKFGREIAQGIAKARGGTGSTGALAGAMVAGGAGAGLGLGYMGTGAMAGAGASVGAGLQRLLSRMTISNPRAVGRFLYSAGADPSIALEVERFFGRIKEGASKAGLPDGIAAMAAVEALDERARKKLEQEGSALKFLGL